MGKKTRSLIVIGLLIAGIAVMAYPAFSSYINAIHSSRAVQALSAQLEGTGSAALEEQRRLAAAYNDAVSTGAVPGDYGEILDFGNGIMGSLRIPRIDVELPIYHGVSDGVLQKGVGHMPRSAFPIGGAGNHSVLTGHTGLPSARLLTDLTELTEGDRFFLQVLGEELVYEVDQITVVLPYEVDALGAVRGRDYCTLVTCTPYGINSHRLLVRGERVPAEKGAVIHHAPSAGNDGVPFPPELLVAGALVAALLAAAVGMAAVKTQRAAAKCGSSQCVEKP